jgi:hypothetical protein
MRSTTIPGPFDHLSYDDKVKIQAMVPETWHIKYFTKIFPRRGAQDRIITNLLVMFFECCAKHGLPEEYNSINEKIAQKVLNELRKQLK